MNSSSAKRTLLIGFALALTILLIFGIQVGTVFELKDDHRIVRFSDQHHSHYQVPASLGSFIGDYLHEFRVDVEQTGRFRPFTWVLEIGLPKLVGSESIAWRIAWIGLTVLFGLLVYALGLRIFGIYSIAIVFALVAVLCPDPGPLAVWHKIGAKSEAFGAFFLVTAMLIATYAPNKNGIFLDGLAFTLLALAVLTKESFTLLIPAIALFRVWTEMTMTRKRFLQCLVDLRFLITIYLLLFTVILILTMYTAVTASSQSYGGRSINVSISDVSMGMRNSILYAPGMVVWFIPVVGAAILGIRKHGVVSFMKVTWLPVTIVLLWTVPQFILYSTRGGMWEHYWMPTILGLSGLNAAALYYLSVNSGAKLRMLFWGVTVIWLLNAIRIDIPALVNYGSKADMQQTVMNAVASRLDAGKKLVVVSDMDRNSELAFSIIYFASYYGASGFDALLYDVSEKATVHRIRNSEFSFTSATFFPHSPALSEIPANCVEAIVFLDTPVEADEVWQRWFESGHFEMHSVIGVQRHLSVKKLMLDEQHLRLDYAFRRTGFDANCEKQSAATEFNL